MKIAFSFAGQGSQRPGMALDLYNEYPIVREAFDEASQVLKRDMAQLCFHSEAEVLLETCNTQPALVTVEVAMYRLLNSLGVHADYLAGFSVGECSALIAAQAVSPEAGYQLTAHRAQYMQQAVPKGQGAMLAIVGQTAETVEALCKETGEAVWPANYNSPQQVVISGTQAGVSAVRGLAEARGITAIPLAVGIPSHCPLMQSASEAFDRYLESIEFKPPVVPIATNVDAKITTQPQELRRKLVQQLISPVRYEQTLYTFRDKGVDTFVELGPGKTLSGLVKHTLQGVGIYRVENIKSLTSLLQAIGPSC